MTINAIQSNFQLKYQAPKYQISEKNSKNKVSFTSGEFHQSITRRCDTIFKYALPAIGAVVSFGGLIVGGGVFMTGAIPSLAATIKPGGLGAKDIIYENHNLTWMGGGIIIIAGIAVLATSIVRGLIEDRKSKS